MNLGADGAETVEGGYDVNASEYLNDITVNNIILNGYPYKTVSELNVDNESEARYATQFAIWIKLNNLDIDYLRFQMLIDNFIKISKSDPNTLYYLKEYERLRALQSWSDFPEAMGR